jgi:predicted PurR-regulated permease PerM
MSDLLAGPTRKDSGSGSSGRSPERVVSFRPRSVLIVLGLVVGVLAAVGFVLIAQHALTLIAISLFLALALNPAVQFFERRGCSRGMAVGAVSIAAVIVAGLLGLVLIPPLVSEIGKFIDALPSLVTDITKGRGTLGNLADKYHVVDKVKDLGSSDALSGAAHPVLTFASGVIGTVLGALIVGFMTLFMLIEGRDWRRRILEVIPHKSQPRWERIGSGLYQAVGGFVTGNLVASVLDGLVAMILMLVFGIPYAVPIALLVVVLELLPYLGPALVTVLLALVGLISGPISAVIIAGSMVVWHAIEGHSIRPMIYGRALKLSPLAVLVAFIVGIEVAGIFGAVVAIPVAGAIQVIVAEILAEREAARESAVLPPSLSRDGAHDDVPATPVEVPGPRA